MVHRLMSAEERVWQGLSLAIWFFIAEKYQSADGNESMLMMPGILEGLIPIFFSYSEPGEHNEAVRETLQKRAKEIERIRAELADCHIIVDGLALIYSFTRHFKKKQTEDLDEVLVRARALGLQERPASIYFMTNEELHSLDAYKKRGLDLRSRLKRESVFFRHLES
jgi:hypothetical protein